ncbi:MAG: hybrid sensor histidine kinase/response regulator [Longimicrobiales bacterium]
MSPEDLSARLRATFVQELEDQLRMMDASLLALEAHPGDAEAIRTLFRAAHSVKGAARVAGVGIVEEACHALEELFAEVRDGRRTLSGGDFSLLFAATDALEEVARRLRANESLDDSTLPAVIERIRRAGDGAAGSADVPGGAQRVAPTEQAQDVARARPGDARAGDAGAEVASVESDRTASSQQAEADDAVTHDTTTAAPELQAQPHPAPAPVAPESVRVSADKLDELGGWASDLLTTSGAVATHPRELEQLVQELARWAGEWRQMAREYTEVRLRDEHGELDRHLHQMVEQLSQITRGAYDQARVLARATDDILTGVRGLRMRGFADAVQALPRAVRDVASATGKQAELIIEGEDVEADRIVIDALREPLLHLVRNAVDHGIESPAERSARGKPAQGTVRVTAAMEQGRLRITVEDDGRGLDTAAIRRRIREQGEEVPAEARALARRLLAGGVTTREQATNISGRGVGLDLVRSAMERIGGSLDVAWREGRFTRFLIDSPPSPATLRAVIVEASDQLFALPIGQVERVERVRAAQVHEVEGRPALALGDAPVPIATLAGVMGPPLRERTELDGAPALLLRAGADALALVVDAVTDEREVVVRPLERRAHVSHVSGGALLPNGRIALVLVARSLVEAGLQRELTLPHVARPDDAAQRGAHVLVVDDSITTRTLEQSVLEAAGYRVTVAVDGQDAWEKMLNEPVDLIVSDVEMPRMTGFDLCRRVRGSKRFAEVPVVLVTGMETAEDRALGLEVGADAYILKSSFDQGVLLDTIRQLIG